MVCPRGCGKRWISTPKRWISLEQGGFPAEKVGFPIQGWVSFSKGVFSLGKGGISTKKGGFPNKKVGFPHAENKWRAGVLLSTKPFFFLATFNKYPSFSAVMCYREIPCDQTHLTAHQSFNMLDQTHVQTLHILQYQSLPRCHRDFTTSVFWESDF